MQRDGYLNETRAFALLEQCKARIKRLEENLESERRLQTTLENNLLDIRKKRTTIYHLPEELLLQIFMEMKLVSRREAAVAPIGAIFLTCKDWNQIATRSRTLWTELSLTVLPDPASIARDISYVKANIRYSQSASLNIRIDLPLDQHLWTFMAQKLCETRTPFFAVPQSDYHGFLENTFAYHQHKFQKIRLYKEVDSAICALMSAIVGENGVNLLRVRSIAISFNSEQLRDWIKFNFFHHPTPILEEINIFTIDGPSSLPPIFIHPCPNLSHLSYNSANTVGDLITSMIGRQLVRYGISLVDGYGLFPNVDMARNLKHLFIEFSDVDDFQPPDKPISFPVLEDFGCLGTYPIYLIQAPKLTTLRLLDRYTRTWFLAQDCPFPHLQQLHLWSYKVDRNVLNSYIGRMPSLKEIYLVHNRAECVPMELLQIERENLTIRAYICPKDGNTTFYLNFASDVDFEYVVA